MPRSTSGLINHRSDMGDQYCEAIEKLRDHCEETGQSYMQTMIEIIAQKLTDDRRGMEADDARDHA